MGGWKWVVTCKLDCIWFSAGPDVIANMIMMMDLQCEWQVGKFYFWDTPQWPEAGTWLEFTSLLYRCCISAVQQPAACLDTFGPSRGCWWLNIFSSFSVIPTLVRFTESRKLGVGIYFCLLTVIVRTTCRLTVIRWSASQNCWLMELSAFNRLRLLQTALCCSTTCTVFQLIWEIGKSNLTCLTWQNAQPSG